MIAIITDSTCDLTEAKLKALKVRRVPLYVNFKGKVHQDWLEITPKDIVEGVQGGAGLPSTSQPSPQDFETVYQRAASEGGSAILCLTISSELSGTYQSANLAKDSAPVPVTVFDTLSASLGLGAMVIRAVEMRDEGKDMASIVKELERIRDSSFILFTVGGLDFLQKGGRIGRAGALVGSLLNIKPILGLKEGKIEPLAKVRGAKKAQQELVNQVKSYREKYKGKLILNFLHVQDPAAANGLREQLKAEGITFRDDGTSELGAVITAHVGPGTYGLSMHTE